MPQSDLLHLSYASELRRDDDALRDEIVRQASENNVRIGITGCIAFEGVNCAQILEGPADVVEELFARIVRDERHSGVVDFVRSPIGRLHFAAWGMRRWPRVDLVLLSGTIAEE